METWPNKSVKKQPQQGTDSSFAEFISRGSPIKFEAGSTSQQEGKTPSLPEGQRPSINEVLGETLGLISLILVDPLI